MDIEELIDKYRNTKRQIRFGLVAMVALLPALNTWLEQGEVLDARKGQIQSELNDERQKYEAAKQKVAELPALMSKLTEIEDELTKAKQILPDRIEMENILAALGRLEKEVDVKIAKFTPGVEYQPNPSIEYKELPVELVLQGQFPQIMRFFDRLVHMPNLTHIRNIQFSTPSKDSTKPSENPALETSAKLILFKGI